MTDVIFGHFYGFGVDNATDSWLDTHMTTTTKPAANQPAAPGHTSTFCPFHGNMHRDAEAMQTESADRCIYEVVPR